MRYADPDTGGVDDLENATSRHALSDDSPALVHAAKDKATIDIGHGDPCVDGALGPTGHRHGADSSALADQIDDDPTSIVQLDVLDRKTRSFPATQAAADQYGE